MKNILGPLWDSAMEKLGNFSSFVPAVLSQIKVKLSEGDAAGVHQRGVELVEAGQALSNLGQKLADATLPDADGQITLTPTELADAAVALEHAIDEFEDVMKGFDEDDAPAP